MAAYGLPRTMVPEPRFHFRFHADPKAKRVPMELVSFGPRVRVIMISQSSRSGSPAPVIAITLLASPEARLAGRVWWHPVVTIEIVARHSPVGFVRRDGAAAAGVCPSVLRNRF
jgi:hypothetical protein